MRSVFRIRDVRCQIRNQRPKRHRSGWRGHRIAGKWWSQPGLTWQWWEPDCPLTDQHTDISEHFLLTFPSDTWVPHRSRPEVSLEPGGEDLGRKVHLKRQHPTRGLSGVLSEMQHPHPSRPSNGVWRPARGWSRSLLKLKMQPRLMKGSKTNICFPLKVLEDDL